MLTIRTTFCSVMIDRVKGTLRRYDFTLRDMMPAIAIDECTHSPKKLLRIHILMTRK